MSYVLSKKIPNVEDKGFIVGDRFIKQEESKLPISTEGLVFYHSFNGVNTSISDIGNKSLSITTGTVSYMIEDGIPCGYFNNAGLSHTKLNELQDFSPFTMSCWFKGINANAAVWICAGQSGNTNAGIAIHCESNQFIVSNSGTKKFTTKSFDTNKWHFLCLTCDGSVFNFYVDNKSELQGNIWAIIQDSRAWAFGCFNPEYYPKLNGYISSARFYNRALDGNEIKALSQEF